MTTGAGVGALRVGVHSGQQYAEFATLLRLWSRAEQLGYDWVSLFDHYRPPMSGPAGPCLDGPTALAALAALVPRVRCGLLVSTTAWRHPAVAAAVAATIDQVSGGRVEFGIGVGGPDLAFEQYGIERPDLSERFEQLDEACRVLRLLWGGGPVDFTGRHYTLRAAHLAPRPVQAHLPLVVGGAGERRTLPLVARHADVWNCLALPLDRYRRVVDVLGEHCAAAGREPGRVRRSVTFRAVITDSDVAAARARERVAADADGRAADLAEYVSFGSAQECLDRLAPYVELGARDLLIGLRPPVDEATLERFATDVVPHLRRVAT